MSWVQTFTDRRFDLFTMDVSQICIEDIAHALSLLCRFNGHCRKFYSVAQHSVLVCDLVPKELKLAALMHDAAEAYIGDVTRPLKRTLYTNMGDAHRLEPFKLLEQQIKVTIFAKFGICNVEHSEIKHADDVMLATEARDLLGRRPAEWEALPDPATRTVVPWGPGTSENLFLSVFHQLHRGWV